MTNPENPIVCDLTALPDRAAHEHTTQQLLAQATALSETSAGYTVHFPVEVLPLAATFVDGERRCCPFLHFAISIAPAATTLTLDISGPAAAKMLLHDALMPQVPALVRSMV